MVCPCEAPAGYGFCARVLPAYLLVVFSFDLLAVPVVPTLIFLDFEEEVEPLGVFLTASVDLVYMWFIL